MPKMSKEADTNSRDAALAFRRGTGRDAAESRINVYAANAREMCET
jgi:hypothetical protein